MPIRALVANVLSWKEAEELFRSQKGYTAANYYALEKHARLQGFTITHIGSYAMMMRVKDQLQVMIEEGQDVLQFQAWAQTQGLAWSRAYTELVFRMAVFGSYSQARFEQINHPEVAREFEILFYDAINDGRTRSEHSAMSGKSWKRKDFPSGWWPQNGFNCFPGNALASARVEHVYRQFYEGEMIEFQTRGNGDEPIRVTPNHPVATPSGWLVAKDLKRGTKVLSCCEDTRPGPGEHKQHPPMRFDDLFELAAKVGDVSVHRVAPDDFNGDSVGTDGKVEIARPPRELRIGAFAELSKGYADFMLANPDSTVPQLGMRVQPGFGGAGRSSGDFNSNVFETARNVTFGMFGIPEPVGDDSYRQPLSIEGRGLGGDTSPPGSLVKDLLFAKGSELDSSLDEHACDGILINPAASTEGAQALADLVQLDEVIEVRRVPFSGHVYDLQSPDGIIISRGLVFSNCRCEVRAVTQKMESKAGLSRQAGAVKQKDGSVVKPDVGFRKNYLDRESQRLLLANRLRNAKAGLGR